MQHIASIINLFQYKGFLKFQNAFIKKTNRKRKPDLQSKYLNVIYSTGFIWKDGSKGVGFSDLLKYASTSRTMTVTITMPRRNP